MGEAMNAAMLQTEHHWACPNCPVTDVTRQSAPHTRFHACRGLRGMLAPMVPAGTRCKVEAVERQDYVAGEQVRADAEGRPVMAVVTTRDDGTDCAVFAPCATGRTELA
jgi:hypothetical protein